MAGEPDSQPEASVVSADVGGAVGDSRPAVWRTAADDLVIPIFLQLAISLDRGVAGERRGRGAGARSAAATIPRARLGVKPERLG